MQVVSIRYNTDHKSPHLRIYLNNNILTDLVDKWFGEQDILSMKVRSKAWNKVKRTAFRRIEKQIATYFHIPEKAVRWSQKCGCRCGCSPGYLVKVQDPMDWNLCRRTMHAEILPSAEDIHLVKACIHSEKVKKLLTLDWEEHNNSITGGR